MVSGGERAIRGRRAVSTVEARALVDDRTGPDLSNTAP